MVKRIAFLCITIIISLCVLAGCGNNSIKYNAVLYDNANDWIREEFLNENRTRGAYFDIGGEINSADKSNPKSRTFIVDNQEEYDEIFISDLNEFDFDFDNQMLIVFTFTTIYHRNNKIKSLDMQNGILKINYKMESKSGVGDASVPYQRWFVVKLDLLNIDSVEFEEN